MLGHKVQQRERSVVDVGIEYDLVDCWLDVTDFKDSLEVVDGVATLARQLW